MVLTLKGYPSDLSVALPDAMAGYWALESNALVPLSTTHKFPMKSNFLTSKFPIAFNLTFHQNSDIIYM